MAFLSRSALIVAAVFFSVGLASGVIWYLHRDDVVKPHSPGTEAAVPHLVLLVVAAVWFLVASRRSPLGWKVLLSPLGRPIAGRIAATFRRFRPLRWMAVAFLVFVQVFSAWRAGEQVFAGLDPNFTHNAWGGPSYLGAMLCHYLDAGVIVAVCHVLMTRLTPGGAVR